jgi:hypothetical protein
MRLGEDSTMFSIIKKRPLLVTKVNAKKLEIYNRMVDELTEAFNLIIDEDHWCQRAMCRDKNDEQLYYPGDEKATKWCLMGAIHRGNCSPETLTYLKNCGRVVGITDLFKFNDFSNHTDVIAFMIGVMERLGVKLMFYDKEGKVIKV